MKSYSVVINGIKTNLLLSEKDARKRGLFNEPKKAEETKSATPPNKARRPANKSRADAAKSAFIPPED